MPYPVLPGFDTSALDASKNGQELCNELKRLYDHLMTAVACQRFKWDKVEYTYNADDTVNRVDFFLDQIRIQKEYRYSNGRLSYQSNWILGVPPDPAEWHYIHGKTYNYDSDGRVISITNRTQ